MILEGTASFQNFANGNLYLISYAHGIEAGPGISFDSYTSYLPDGSIITGGTISVKVDNDTIKINGSGELYADVGSVSVNGDVVYQSKNSLATTGDSQPTGVTVSYDLATYAEMKVFINGQIQFLGGTTSNCYFSNDGGATSDGVNGILKGDELYWNGDILYNLEITDNILLTYITSEVI